MLLSLQIMCTPLFAYRPSIWRRLLLYRSSIFDQVNRYICGGMMLYLTVACTSLFLMIYHLLMLLLILLRSRCGHFTFGFGGMLLLLNDGLRLGWGVRLHKGGQGVTCILSVDGRVRSVDDHLLLFKSIYHDLLLLNLDQVRIGSLVTTSSRRSSSSNMLFLLFHWALIVIIHRRTPPWFLLLLLYHDLRVSLFEYHLCSYVGILIPTYNYYGCMILRGCGCLRGTWFLRYVNIVGCWKVMLLLMILVTWRLYRSGRRGSSLWGDLLILSCVVIHRRRGNDHLLLRRSIVKATWVALDDWSYSLFLGWLFSMKILLLLLLLLLERHFSIEVDRFLRLSCT